MIPSCLHPSYLGIMLNKMFDPSHSGHLGGTLCIIFHQVLSHFPANHCKVVLIGGMVIIMGDLNAGCTVACVL